MQHCGFTGGPLKIRLAKAQPGLVGLRIVERQDGLPDDKAKVPLEQRERASWLAPQESSDVSLVSQVVRF
jgi:hypothetical protein